MTTEDLKRQAELFVKLRGHVPGPWQDGDGGRLSDCECVRCGRDVRAIAKPWPNEADVSGEAVSMHCERWTTSDSVHTLRIRQPHGLMSYVVETRQTGTHDAWRVFGSFRTYAKARAKVEELSSYGSCSNYLNWSTFTVAALIDNTHDLYNRKRGMMRRLTKAGNLWTGDSLRAWLTRSGILKQIKADIPNFDPSIVDWEDVSETFNKDLEDFKRHGG
jgi:hypothetical protein